MKTTVVTGLLGSGKTTFIKHRTRHTGEKTVVLVNDFGAAGIDGEIFSADGIESVELPSGCVCCTLKFDLITTIQKIMKEFKPEHLVIEPSGIASPGGVLEALESAGVRSYSVIGIVDVTEFTELFQSGMYGTFFRDQVALSDVILVNKMDLVDEGKLVEAEKLVASINPRAITYRTKNAELSARFAEGFLPLQERAGMKGNGREEGGTIVFRTSEHFQFETLSFTLTDGTRMAPFSAFFEALVQGRYGKVVRAKALLGTDEGPYRFDGVYGKADTVSFEKDVAESRLVIIGEKLDKVGIERALKG